MAIHIGTSGFSYKDWRGHFYPEDLKDRDMLSYYARHFATVEVNSTYYRLPGPETFARMREKVPSGFRFTVKATREMTHDFATAFAGRAGALDEGAVDALFGKFAAALEPLNAEGQLGCVLAQFPGSFHDTQENRDYLRRLPDRLPGLPTVVELRNREWVTDETSDLLRGCGLGFCCVDEPRLKGLMPPVALSTSPVGYVRFHGRNAAKWWQHDEAWERYNYLYSEAELQEWVPKVRGLAAETRDTFVFFNNHYQGKAGKNAQMFLDLLGLAEA